MSSTIYTDFNGTHFNEYYSTSGTFEHPTNSINITQHDHKVQLALYDILTPLLAAIIIALNLAVVISSGLILKKGSQPVSTYLFLGNVALSDLTTAIAILIGNFVSKENRSELICAFSLGLIVSSTIVSIYSVGLIAVDRYLYIIHGLQYQRWLSPLRARIFVAITWLIGCIVGFLPIMGWAGETYNGQQCWFISLVPPKLILMTCLIGLVPIVLVIVLYSIILYYAIKKVVQLRSAGKQANKSDNALRIFRGRSAVNESTTIESPKETNCFKRFFKKSVKSTNTTSPSKSKAVKIVMFTTGSFVITWVPYFIASFLYIMCDKNLTPERCKSLQILIASPLAILGFLNSLLNPFIYAWWHSGFRNFVKKKLCKRKINTNTSNATNSTNIDKCTSRKNSGYDNKAADLELQMVNIDLN